MTGTPTLLPRASRGETFAGFRYSLDGELIPVLTIALDQTQSVYFEGNDSHSSDERGAQEGGDGILWLHGYGNVFELTLGPGETMDVEPSAWLYKDPSVTGPGQLGIQSMSLFGMMSND